MNKEATLAHVKYSWLSNRFFKNPHHKTLLLESGI